MSESEWPAGLVTVRILIFLSVLMSESMVTSKCEFVSVYVSCVSEPVPREREKMVRPTWKGSQHRTNAKTITPGEGEEAEGQGEEKNAGRGH